MDIILAVVMGVALAAACGFRVFVPLLVAAIGVRTGDIAVAESFSWVGSDAAIILLAVATALEIAAYYIPWVDNALDLLATPVAIVAGTLVTATFVVDTSPMFGWAIAIIAGGGIAGTIQVATVGVRALSTAATGGLANPIVSTTETAIATTLAVLAIVVPIVALLAIVLIGVILYKRITRGRRAAAQLNQASPQATIIENTSSHAPRIAVASVVVEPQ